MKIDGQCHCGGIAYEAEVEPDRVSVRHCTDCQALTGSAFRVTVLTSPDAFRLTAGAPKLGDNGRKRLQFFCPDCGSPLFTTGEGADAGEWGIRWGSVRQRAVLPPRHQTWCGSALPWTTRLAELPGVPGD